MKSSHSYYFLNFQVKDELFLCHILPVLLDKIKIPVILIPLIVWWLRENLLRTSFGKYTIISHLVLPFVNVFDKGLPKPLKLIENCHLLMIFL